MASCLNVFDSYGKERLQRRLIIEFGYVGARSSSPDSPYLSFLEVTNHTCFSGSYCFCIASWLPREESDVFHELTHKNANEL